MSQAVSRNDPCPCGSGLKYKKCCLPQGGVETGQKTRRLQILAVLVVVLAAVSGFLWGRETAFFVGGGLALLLGAYYFLLGDPPPPTKGGNPGAINFGR